MWGPQGTPESRGHKRWGYLAHRGLPAELPMPYWREGLPWTPWAQPWVQCAPQSLGGQRREAPCAPSIAAQAAQVGRVLRAQHEHQGAGLP